MSTRPILLSGTVHGDSLTHTLQLLHAEGRTGHLHVHTPTGPGTLHLHAGRLTHAAYAGQVGEAALPALFQLPPGTFEVFADPPTTPVTITRPLTQVLLTAAVALDHQAAEDAPHVPLPVARVSDAELEADLLGRDSPLRPTPEWVPALIANLQGLTLGADAWRVLTAVDGQRDITVIAAHVALPLEQVRNVLAEHAARGHLTYLPPLLPAAFWTDVRAAATKVLGPACLFLLRDAATQVGAAPEQIPTASGRAFLDALGALASPARRAALHAQLSPLRATYAL
ncbi:DUF4388 domain-containing protein [Deinococcus soli (ex Cha et al. 2016)]|uniref:DUF4388 domain-containing protein n=1 Tax=Deinococcus soli (ex Cha et al. 2016) TaxID=1309411 RepID=UPI00166EEEC0|nr:DUF4388 domain-containing protein [Deinococcus soli (ex Cha et al. 2016)]GGB76454.1 hypothetical protein GCM10008019_35820 [Deinococcus soli (ex Cha et al. 2016)]